MKSQTRCRRSWCTMLAAALLLVGCRQLASYGSAPAVDTGRADHTWGDLRHDGANDGGVDLREDGPRDLSPEGSVSDDGIATDSIATDGTGPDLGSPATMGLCWQGWCFEHPRPQGLDLYAVDCFSKDACLAVGQRGIVLYYDGNGWQTIEHTASTAPLNTVHMTGKTSALLGGSDGALLNMQGLKITSELAPTAQTINAVWVDASGTYLAAQDGFHARSSSGTGWAKSTLGSEAGVALWGVGSTLFVGSTAGLYRRQGSGALQKVCSSSGSIYDISGGSAQDVFFVTYDGKVSHFDGTNCATTPAYTFSQAGVSDIVRLSNGAVYAVSDSAAATYQATQGWHALPGLSGRGIADDRKGGVWVVGRRGLLRRVVGATIDALDVSATQQVLRRAIETKAGAVAIGQQGAILLRATSGSWQAAPFPAFPTSIAWDAWASDQQQVYIAAVNAGLWRGEVSSFTQATTVPTLAVWGLGTDLYLGHVAGKLSRIDANGVLVLLSSSLAGHVNAIAGQTSGALYLAAGQQLGLFNGTTAVVKWSDTGADLQRVSAVAQGAVAVGGSGFIVLCDTPANCSVLVQRPEPLAGVAATSLDDFYVVTADAVVLHYVQRSLLETLPLPMISAGDVTIDKQGVVRVYGRDGSIVVRAP